MLGEEIVGMVTVMVLDHQPTTGELGVVVREKVLAKRNRSLISR